MNVKLPANAIWTIRSNSAGTQVMSSRNDIRIDSLPKMYSARVNGLDR